MTVPVLPRPPRERRRPRRGRTLLLRLLAGVVVVGGILALGVALGQALHDNPKPEGAQTIVRTLKPLPLAPAPVTVTVTATGP